MALAALVAAGCSLTTDLTGFSTAEDAPSVTDGGTDTSTDGPGSPSPESGTDGARPDASGPFCVPGAHAFCEDFDTITSVPTWDGRSLDAKGAISLSTLRAMSPPRSFLSTMERRSGADPYAQATIHKSFAGWRRVIVELDIFVEAPAFAPGDINSGILSMFLASSSGTAGFALSIGDGYTTLGIPEKFVGGPSLLYDAWRHARFDIDPAGTVSGSIGQVTWNGTFPAATAGGDPATIVEIGVNGYNQPAPPYRVFYDNLTVDFP